MRAPRATQLVAIIHTIKSQRGGQPCPPAAPVWSQSHAGGLTSSSLGKEYWLGMWGLGLRSVFLQVSGGWRARKDPDLWSDSSRPWGPEMAARLPTDRDHVSACVPVPQTFPSHYQQQLSQLQGCFSLPTSLPPLHLHQTGEHVGKNGCTARSSVSQDVFSQVTSGEKRNVASSLDKQTERPSPGPAFSLYLDGNIPGIKETVQRRLLDVRRLDAMCQA